MKASAILVVDVQQGILALPNLLRRRETDRALDEMVERVAGLIGKAPDGVCARDLCSARWRSRSPARASYLGMADSTGNCASRRGTGGPQTCLRRVFRDESRDGTQGARHSAIDRVRMHDEYCIDTTVRRAVSLGQDVILAADGHISADTSALRFEQVIAITTLCWMASMPEATKSASVRPPRLSK